MRAVHRGLARNRDNGAAAVEFALVMVPLIMLVFGIISFGMFFAQKLALTNGARQAARMAVVHGNTCQDIFKEAKSAAVTLGVDPTSADFTFTAMAGPSTVCPTTNGEASDAVSGSTLPCETMPIETPVHVTLTWKSFLLIPLVVVDNDLTVTGEGVFRCEYS